MSDHDYREFDPNETDNDISDEVIEEVTGNKDSSKDDKKDNKTTEFCYICHRPDNITGPLIKMAPGMSVCTECMQRTFDSMGSFGFGGGDNSKSNMDMSKMPNISFLNLGNLFNDGPKIKNAHGTAKAADEKDRPAPAIDINNIIPPHKIKEKLDEYVVGQDYAKKVMSVAVYNHYKRVATGTMDDIEIEKSNMLMLGPTGSGKTYLVRTLARLLDVPLAITDATSLTEAGYIGDDIESVVSKLLAAAGNDVERCQQGIIFIDEIDKLAKKKNTNQRDVSGESVQQGMLKLLEGADVEVPIGASSKNAMVPTTTINTRNILFICGGAFPAMDEIIKSRLNKHSSMGFMADLKDKYDNDKNILQKVTVEDLREFGMIPEFIGRLPIVFATEMLDENMLVRILKEPKNAIIKQYKLLFEMDGVRLSFEEDAIREIAALAYKRKTGARGLRSILEGIMTDVMFEIPSDESISSVVITKAAVDGSSSPLITRVNDLKKAE